MSFHLSGLSLNFLFFKLYDLIVIFIEISGFNLLLFKLYGLICFTP